MYDMEQRVEIYDAWMKADPFETYDDYFFNIDSITYLVFISPNLEIRDIFTEEEVTDVYDRNSPADKGKFAIYTLNQYLSHRRQLLLFNKGEFTAFYVDDYPKVIHKIITYFKKHKDLDERLLPLCIQEVTKIYVANRRTTDQFGPWRHWWSDDADSLGRIYNEHLRWN